MPTKRINQLVRELPFEKKLIGAGSLSLAISLFLPWYADIDSFRTGDIFSGLSGPLYLVGLTFLVFCSLSLLLIVTDHLGIKMPISSLKSSKVYLGFGIASFYLLILVNSVYYDRNFGVNITQKDPGFGMFLAFIAAAMITIGGYLNTRERSTAWKEFEEETRSTAIKMPTAPQQKPKEGLRTVHTNPHQPNPIQGIQEPTTPAQVAGEKRVTSLQNMLHDDLENDTSDEKSPQPYRLDL